MYNKREARFTTMEVDVRLAQVGLKQLVVFRHGLFSLNERARLRGEEALRAVAEGIPEDADATLGLLPEGIRQAEALQGILKEFPITACFCSPTQRTHETAKIALSRRTIALFRETRLQERNRGIYGYAPDEWAKKHPQYYINKSSTWEWKPPGGESLEELRRQIPDLLNRAVRIAPEGVVAFSTHADRMVLLRGVLLDLTDEDFDRPLIPNCGDVKPLQRANWVVNGQVDVYDFTGRTFRTMIAETFDTGPLKAD